MALIDIVRNGVKIVSKVTDSLKESVTLEAWVGSDGKGADSYAAPVTLEALVSRKKEIRYTDSAGRVLTIATLTFVDPVADTTPNVGETREQPIDPRDVVTLADGSTAPVVETGGFADAATGRPFALKVVLGHAITG